MIQRQQNFLNQQRVDVPHLRALESSACSDMDLLAGTILAGGMPLVVSGFDLVTSGAVGAPATSLQLSVAGGILCHVNASEAGTIFSVVGGTPVEVLSGTNPNIIGSFTPASTNYIGLDLRRAPDDSTSDLVEFEDANTLLEAPRVVPLARTLSYRIIISTIDFSSNPTILPIAIVATDATNAVTSIADARSMFFRLGSGGTAPDAQSSYVWQNRNETIGSFQGGDKAIGSLKDSLDAIMTRLWELGGGEYWYSPTSDRDTKLALGQPVIVANGDNFLFDSGAGTIQWSGLTVLFANSTATYNTITANTIALPDGYCLYVDVNRHVEGTVLTALTAPLASLGSPTVPGSRFVIAWRKGTSAFTRTTPYEVGRQYKVASTAAGASGLGIVRLSVTPGSLSAPSVIPLDANGQCINTITGGTGAAFVGSGGANGDGVTGTSGTLATGDHPLAGVRGTGLGNGYGVYGIGGSGGYGVYGQGGTNQPGVYGAGNGSGAGLYGAGGGGGGGGWTAPGVYGVGGLNNGDGLSGLGGGTTGRGLYAHGASGGIGAVVVGGAGAYGLQVTPGAGAIAIYALGCGAGTGVATANIQSGAPGDIALSLFAFGGDPAISIAGGEIKYSDDVIRKILVSGADFCPDTDPTRALASATFNASTNTWKTPAGGLVFALGFKVHIPANSQIGNVRIYAGNSSSSTSHLLNFYLTSNGTQVYDGTAGHGSTAIAPGSGAWASAGTPISTPSVQDGSQVFGYIQQNSNQGSELLTIYSIEITYTQYQNSHNV